MSSIESVGGSGIDPSYLRQLQTDSDQAARRGRPGMEMRGAGAGRGAMADRLDAVAAEAGLDSEAVNNLREDLKAAISSAMEGGSVGESDGNNTREAVRSAILDTLSKYGIEPEKLRPDAASGRPRGTSRSRGMVDQSGASDLTSVVGSQEQTGDNPLLISLLAQLGLVDEEA